MGYRGRDLNLSTAEHLRGGAGTGRFTVDGLYNMGGGDEARGGGILLVDDAVLSCCNHAYDLALAHRSPEVGLQHLLNAMTRIDAAASVLVALGIDAGGLRHDTASLIAADEAMISGNERLSPRRSQDLADALNFAAERARLRRASVSVADVLHALFELNREQPGLVMLKRNAPGWQQRPFPEASRQEPLPPLMSGAYQVDPRYVPADVRAAEPPREWVRVPQQAYYPAPAPGYYVAEPAPAQLPPQAYYVAEAPAAAPVGSTMTDAVQNSRLDQLERTIRELSGELSAERKAFSQLVGELKRDVVSHTDSTMRLRGGLDDRLAGIEQMVMSARSESSGAMPQTADRLASLERNVDAKFGDLARGWTVLGERLQALEAAVTSDRGETAMPAALADRLQSLDTVARTLNTLAERMTGLERQIAARPAAAMTVNLQPVLERLDAIEHAQQLRPAATSAALAPVIERLSAIERLQSSRSPGPVVDLGPVFERLNAIEARVTDAGRGTTAFADRFAQFERKLDAGSGATERTTTQLTDRLRAIEDTMVSQRNQVAQLATNLAADVKMLGQTVTAQGTGAERMQSFVGERFQSFTASIERQQSEFAAQVAQPLAERLAILEKQVQMFGQRTLDLHAAHGKDLVELHDELVKLNSNQHTLAASMDQWRLDSGTELGQLGTKLDTIESGAARPLQMLETLQTNVQTLQRTTAKREEQRSRFRHWLMGTDDWYGASWEEQPREKQRPRAGNGNGATPVRAADQLPKPAQGTPPTRPAGPARG